MKIRNQKYYSKKADQKSRLFFLTVSLFIIFDLTCYAQVQEKLKVALDNYADIYEIKKDSIYNLVEKMPHFPGGEEKLLNFIHKNLRLDPAIEFGQGIPERVIMKFVVTKTGSIENIRIVHSIDNACDKEAIRVITLLPDFIPGEHNGKKVAVWYSLPVSFKQ